MTPSAPAVREPEPEQVDSLEPEEPAASAKHLEIEQPESEDEEEPVKEAETTREPKKEPSDTAVAGLAAPSANGVSVSAVSSALLISLILSSHQINSWSRSYLTKLHCLLGDPPCQPATICTQRRRRWYQLGGRL